MAVSSETVRNIVLVDTVRNCVFCAAVMLSVVTWQQVVDVPRLRQCAKHGLPDELRCDVWKYLLGVSNPDKSEVAPNEKQLSDEFLDVISSIGSEALFLRAGLAQSKLMRFSARATSTLVKRAESTHRVTVAALASALVPPPPEHDIGCVALASGARADRHARHCD
jgi:hypothetical protein